MVSGTNFSSNGTSFEGPSDEEKRTLWVGGIIDRVDEEVLYELFMNVSDIKSIGV